MSEYTKGELGVSDDYGDSLVIVDNRGEEIATVSAIDAEGNNWVYGVKSKANATELVRRWNAFEEGGSHEALLEACERYVRMQDKINQEMGRKPTNTMYNMMKAAVAAAKKT